MSREQTIDSLPLAQAVWSPRSGAYRQDVESYGAVPATAGKSSRPSSGGGYFPSFDPPKNKGQFGATNDTEPPLILDATKWDDREARNAFIRRVYSILGVQMLITFGVCALMTLHTPTQTYVLRNGHWMQTLSIVLSIVMLIALMCFKDQYPVNMVLLAVWTFVEAFLIGTITALYASYGAAGIVLEAVFLTATVFFALTIFTLCSKWDFSFLGAGLGVCLWILVIWGIFALIFGLRTGYIYALIGSIVFSGYIIFDTWMLTSQLSPDDYIIAAISLYLDIINLFLMLLQLITMSQQQSS